MARRRKRGSESEPEALRKRLLELMERHDTADALNDQVISPFIAAMEAVCGARGYLLNIYGDRSNLIVSTEDHAETIYHLVEGYLDDADLEE